jgi:hypothetical protein
VSVKWVNSVSIFDNRDGGQSRIGQRESLGLDNNHARIHYAVLPRGTYSS